MFKNILVGTGATIALTLSAAARPNYPGTGSAINEFNQDVGTVGVTTRTINVPDNIGITDVNVTLPLMHTWSGDLIIELIFGGQHAVLVSRIGSINGTFGSSSQFGQYTPGHTFANYTFDSQSTNNIWTAAAANPTLPGQNPPGTIPAGIYATSGPGSGAPTLSLSIFNGMDSFGLWTLKITDSSSPNTGVLGDWILTIVPAPSALTLLALAGLLGHRRRRSA